MPRGQRLAFHPVDSPIFAWEERVEESYRVEREPGSQERWVPAGPLWLGEWVGVAFDGLPWGMTVQLGAVGGVPAIVGLKITATNMVIDESEESPRLAWDGTGLDPTITSDLLRQLPLRQLREMAVGKTATPFLLERPPGGWGEDHYRAVAEVYRSAPQAPLKVIRERWGVSRAAASKWVREARERGLLGYPARRGVAGASEPTSPVKAKKAGNPRKGGRAK